MIEADPIWKTRPLDVCMIQHGWYKASDPMKRYLKKMFPKQYYLDSQGKDKLADSNGGENGTGNGPDDAKSVHSAHKSQVSGIAKSEASYAATALPEVAKYWWEYLPEFIDYDKSRDGPVTYVFEKTHDNPSYFELKFSRFYTTNESFNTCNGTRTSMTKQMDHHVIYDKTNDTAYL